MVEAAIGSSRWCSASTAWRTPALTVAFLCAHTAVWTLYALLSHRGAVHGDMLEAYGWGREFQLGYFKHPPFWAWIAGAWFEVFPRTTWAFYLLATLNSGIAVVGVWHLNGLLVHRSKRRLQPEFGKIDAGQKTRVLTHERSECVSALARGIDRFNATALLLLYLAYTLQGHQFNANLILTSLWPWTVYAFVLSMQKRSAAAALLLGALAAACLLSKYYSVLLLFSCAAASFAHPDWRAYYRSAAPYISVGICLALIAPHLWWVAHSGFPTLKYVASKTGFPTTRVYTNMVTFAMGCAALNLAATALVAASRLWAPSPPAPRPIAEGYAQFVGILALGPFVLTLLCAALGHFRISTNFASPIFFLMPLLLIHLLRPAPVRLRRLTIIAVVTLYVAALVIAPAVPYLEGRAAAKPAIEAAHEAVRIWREATHRPLRFIAGSAPYAAATVFYGGDDTSTFADFEQQHTPWVSDAALARDGLLAMCLTDDQRCLTRAAQIAGARQEIELSVPADAGPAVEFRLIVFPPGSDAPGG